VTRTEFEQRSLSNTQLYGQLLAAHYATDDVARVRDAYLLASSLFAAQVRPDGRPFVCHLVGVASLLAMLETAPDTLIAGLLHSAYTHGDFGLGRGQMTRGARERLRAAVGAPAERLVFNYSRHSWNPSTVTEWIGRAGTLDAEERQIVVIRLADTMEDALDFGLHLCAKLENPNRAIPPDSLYDLAIALGYSHLGASLRRVLLAHSSSPDLDRLRETHRGSYTVCPASWREKMLPRFVRLARRIRWDGAG
jgi:hypothetical protein